MSKRLALRRVLGVALAWAALWLALWAIVVVTIGIVDPDSIDPGEPLGLVIVFGPMGLLTGVAFGAFLSMGRGGAAIQLSPIRVVALGILATALVQVAYLGHGDQGLVANIKMAALFSAIGGVVTATWFALARKWPRPSGPRPGV